MHSLSRRLLVAVSLPLALFFGIAIALLDANFRQLAERSLHDLLDAQIVALIAAADPAAGGALQLATPAVEARLETPGSGLYAQVRSAAGQTLWRSPSSAGTFIEFGPGPEPGATRFTRTRLADGAIIEVASRAIAWESEAGEAQHYVFSVAASLTPYDEQLWSFRRRLLGGFAGLAVLLLVTLAALLRWTLAPLRRLEREITEVEGGGRAELGSVWPRELAGVTANLNALLIAERRRLQRYRDTLGNLAHTLKTPLAVMRATLEARGEHSAPDAAERGALQRQIDAMTGIVEHQLQRAAAGGGATIGQPSVAIDAIAAEIRAALLKVYRTKDLSIELLVEPNAKFRGDRSDLFELLGNLLDNACKWCAGRVRLAATYDPRAPAQQQLRLLVEDDGPGIAITDRARVLERGARADEKTSGHGLGLAMVRDTVELYGGAMSIDASPLGGACIELRLPGR